MPSFLPIQEAARRLSSHLYSAPSKDHPKWMDKLIIKLIATLANLSVRQSKLSQEQLSELQRSTHFDKKELQQWYKGQHCSRSPA
jgi:hypothetical protein